MIHTLSTRISKIFVYYGESTEEDADIYAYAVEAVLATLINVAICLFIAAVFGTLSSGIIFILTFASLRRLVGGYHASSHLKCILIFATIFTIAMCGIFLLQTIIGSIILIGVITIALAFLVVILGKLIAD